MTPSESGPARSLSPAALALLARRADVGSPSALAAIAEGPLSFPQLTQWFFAHLYPKSSVFNLPKILALRGSVDSFAVRTTLQAILDRHAALRTTFRLDGAEPVQRVCEPRPVDLASHDLQLTDRADRHRQADELLAADAGRPFDLSSDQLVRALLLRLDDDEWQLQVTFHHIAFDGWSSGIFLSEFEQHYRAAVSGIPANILPLHMQVADAAAWQRAQSDTPALARDREYWREELRDVQPLDVPRDFPVAAEPQHRGGQRRHRLTSVAWQSVADCARQHECTPFVVAFAAWAIITARRCDQPRGLHGITVAGRTREAWEPLIGNFVATVPIVADLDDAPRFSSLLAQVYQRSAAALAHQDFPFQELASEISPARRSGTDTLFPVLFNFRNVPMQMPDALPGVRIESVTMPIRGTVGPLCLNVTPAHDGAWLDLDFDPDEIDDATAERWLDGYVTLLAAATSAPETEVAKLPIMGMAERPQLEAWNQTDRPRDRTLTLPALLARQAIATPDRIAVTAPEAEWSYHQLAEEAQRIAVALTQRGIGPGAFVGVCMERCAGLVATMIGVMNAGAAYVPIDPSLPLPRIVGMLESAGVRLVIVGPGTPPGLDSTELQTLEWDSHESHAAPASDLRALAATDPAYVIFTSGSTGKPKGVVISHSSVVNYFTWMAEEFPLRDDDVMVQMTSIGVDASVWEFWKPLLAGARLVMAPPGQHNDPRALVEVMASHRVTVVSMVPSLLRVLLDTVGFNQLPALRLVCCGGEAMTTELIAAFRRTQHATLSNHYGPTEGTIDSTFFVPGPDDIAGPVPIGRPLANVQAWVADRQGELAPIGTPGELYVGGEGVALGYLGQPDLTAERFIADCYRPGTGRRLYRTGDLARWRHDGLLDFLGRLDSQVKLRGFRIELGEIESALCTVAGIRAAAVVRQPGPGGDERLVGYVELAATPSLDPAAIRTTLKQQLPDYMVPTVITIVSAMPLLPSGKIDRAALPAAGGSATDGRTGSTALESPSTTLELALVDIWGPLLGIDQLGVDDDFFELGGHSLLAAKMVNELERGTGYRIPLATLFKASTIRSLARALVEQSFQTVDLGVQEVQPGAPGRAPFFMLTGDMMGGGFYCRGLARAAGPEQPLYAVPPLPATPEFRDATIERMADKHMADIRRLQPDGPYRLGGFCVGGLVAFEIARRLRLAGQDVDLLLVVDAIPPTRYGTLTRILLHAISFVVERNANSRRDRFEFLALRTETLISMPANARPAALGRFALRITSRVRARFARNTPTIATPMADQRPATPLSKMIRQHMHAEYAYRHPEYAGRTDLVFTPAAEHAWGRPAIGWQRVAADLVIHRVDAGHSEVLFSHLPEILRKQLERVNAATTPR